MSKIETAERYEWFDREVMHLDGWTFLWDDTKSIAYSRQSTVEPYNSIIIEYRVDKDDLIVSSDNYLGNGDYVIRFRNQGVLKKDLDNILKLLNLL